MVQSIAVLGAGTIGASWTALFLAAGKRVVAYDPAPAAEERVRRMIDGAAETLSALGWAKAGDASDFRFVADPAAAVEGAQFIQENAFERLDVKHALYQRIEPALAPDVIIGSSTSGITLSELQAGFTDPARLIIAHPFNPPHLIPLVELVANERTGAEVLSTARAFYEALGKVPVTLKKEAIGHIANRLQAALWREAIHLAAEGVASVEDIDKAVAFGPGLRWAALGPTALFHLGGGEGGIRGFCDHIGPAMEGWWADLGAPHLTPELVDLLTTGMEQTLAATPKETLAQRRDQTILALLKEQGAAEQDRG